jgi:hypothetical protein
MRGRAIRRHHQQVAKARARRLLVLWELPADARRVGIHGSTRVICSCWMCGNPRKHLGEQTWQELRATTVSLVRDHLEH